jgi:hypothetical protein
MPPIDSFDDLRGAEGVPPALLPSLNEPESGEAVADVLAEASFGFESPLLASSLLGEMIPGERLAFEPARSPVDLLRDEIGIQRNGNHKNKTKQQQQQH